MQGAYGDEPGHSDQRAATVQTAVAEAETAQALAANTATIADPAFPASSGNVADAGADASNDSTVEQLIAPSTTGSGMQAVAQGAQAVQQGSASAAAAQSDADDGLRVVAQPQPGSGTPISVTQANGVAATSEVANLSETTQLACRGRTAPRTACRLRSSWVRRPVRNDERPRAGQALAGNYLSLTAPRPQVDEPADQFSVQQLNVGEADSIGANSSYLEQDVVQLQSDSTGSSEDAVHAAIVSQTTQSTTEVQQTNVRNGADQDSFDSAGVSNGDYYQHNAAVATAASANASGTAQASEQEQTGTAGAASEADNEAVVVQENIASASAYQHGVDNGPFENGVSESIATSNAVAYNVSVVDQAIEQSEIVGDTLEPPTGGGPGGGGNPGGDNPGGGGHPAVTQAEEQAPPRDTTALLRPALARLVPARRVPARTVLARARTARRWGLPASAATMGRQASLAKLRLPAPTRTRPTRPARRTVTSPSQGSRVGQRDLRDGRRRHALGGVHRQRERRLGQLDAPAPPHGAERRRDDGVRRPSGGPARVSSSSDVPASASAPEDSGNGLGGAVGSSGGVAAGRAPGFSGSASAPALEGFPVPPDDGGVVVPSPVLQPPGAVVAVLDSPG